MTDFPCHARAMKFREDLGERIRAARRAAQMTVVEAAAKAEISRDTWTKVERGESVQDAKLQAALDTVGLSEVPVAPGMFEQASLSEVAEIVAALEERLRQLRETS